MFAVVVFLACAGLSSGKYKAPKASINRDLNYPLEAQMANIEGNVTVGVFVDENGKPETIRVVQSSGNTDLDSAAVEFARMIGYEPATLDKHPFGSWTQLELRYQLSRANFEENQWLADVLDLQKKLDNSSDPYTRNIYLQRLYLKYTGFADWSETAESYDLPLLIKRTVREETWNIWQKMIKEIHTAFALFYDFYYRYPDCEFKSKVRETLVHQIIDTRTIIADRASEDAGFRKKSAGFLEQLERLQQSLHTEK